MLCSKIRGSNAQTLDESRSETGFQEKSSTPAKPKDRLWKRILRSLYEIIYPSDEPEDDPLEKDPKFLVWKILLKIFLLIVLYTSIPSLPYDYRPVAYSYGIYLILTLILWLHKCLEAYLEYKYKDEL